MPDRYNDTDLGQAPPRTEYSAEQKNLHATTAKKAGGIPGTVQMNSGTDSPRADTETRGPNVRAPAGNGSKHWPAGVQKFGGETV